MLNHVNKMLAMFPVEISPADESTGRQAVYATTLDELPESVFERNCEGRATSIRYVYLFNESAM